MISTEENTVRLPGPSMTPAEAETKLKKMNGENWEKFKKKW